MAKNIKKDAQQLLDMADVNQFQRDIASYSADALTSLSKIFIAFKMENDREGYDLVLKEKISIIRETRLAKEKSETKTVKSIAKVIAKVQEEVKQESVPPPKQQKPRNSSLSNLTIKNSSDTPKNTGINYNNKRGQGDFFGSNSKFKFIQQLQNNMESSSNENQMGLDFGDKVKKTRKARTPTVVKSSITHLDAKALKQIKDILMLPEKMAKKSSVKRTPRRQTKAEKDKFILKQNELGFKKEHLAEMMYKHRSDGRIERRKLKESVGANNSRTELQKRTLEFREKVEANKLKRVELSNNLKEKLAEKHIEYSRLGIEKAKIKRQADKDKQDDRLRLQQKRKDQTNRNQMERHLHGIHPILGMLYGASQNKKEAQEESQGGGLMSSVLGGVAGGVGAGAVGRGFGSSALKMGTRGIPLLGAGIAGISEGLETGNVGKGIATFAGALTGGALIGAAAGAAFGPVGAIVGAIVGNTLGMVAAKDIWTRLDSKKYNPTQTEPTNNVQQVPNTPQSANGKIKKSGSGGSAEWGGDFLAKEEGMNLNAYKDGSNKKTGQQFVSIGRGHQIKDHEYAQGYIQAGGDRVPISGDRGLSTQMTKEQAEALYRKDNSEYSDIARNGLGAEHYDKLTDKQKAALDSYAYNVGSIGGLVKRGLREKIKSGDTQGASEIIRNGIKTKEGVYNQGLDDRRKREAAMFAEKAPSKVSSLQDSTNRMQQKSTEEKSKPINVVSVGGSTGGSSTNISNTYVNPVNTDSTIRQLANNMMFPARLV